MTIKITVMKENGFDNNIINVEEVTLSPAIEDWINKLIEENDARTPAGIVESELEMSADGYEG